MLNQIWEISSPAQTKICGHAKMLYNNFAHPGRGSRSRTRTLSSSIWRPSRSRRSARMIFSVTRRSAQALSSRPRESCPEQTRITINRGENLRTQAIDALPSSSIWTATWMTMPRRSSSGCRSKMAKRETIWSCASSDLHRHQIRKSSYVSALTIACIQ